MYSKYFKEVLLKRGQGNRAIGEVKKMRSTRSCSCCGGDDSVEKRIVKHVKKGKTKGWKTLSG